MVVRFGTDVLADSAEAMAGGAALVVERTARLGRAAFLVLQLGGEDLVALVLRRRPLLRPHLACTPGDEHASRGTRHCSGNLCLEREHLKPHLVPKSPGTIKSARARPNTVPPAQNENN